MKRSHPRRLLLLVISISCIAAAATRPAASTTNAMFQDAFKSKLGAGWSWVREDAKGWRIDDDGLHIRAMPGTLWKETNNARNVLLRPAPTDAAEFALEVSVTN